MRVPEPIVGPSYREDSAFLPDRAAGYRLAWKDRSRRVARVWIVWLLYLPVMGSALTLLKALGVAHGRFLPFALFTAYAVWFVRTVNRQMAFRCPRCGHLFYGERGVFKRQNPWAWRCQHCRLKAGDEPA